MSAAGGLWYSMKKHLLLIGLVAGLAGTFGCSPAKEEKVALPKPRPVNTVVIERRDLPLVVNAVGRLIANREVVLSAQVSGIVESYSVDTGDPATAEQVLVILDSKDYQLALKKDLQTLYGRRPLKFFTFLSV